MLPGLLRRLQARPDTEHEMSLNRLGFAVLIGAYLHFAPSAGDPAMAIAALGLWCLSGICIFLHILAWPGASPTRRAVALLLDIGFLSWHLHIGGEAHALFFPIYLWIVFGNGFRFGLRWLRLGTAAALAGFSAVFLTTPYWGAQPHLSLGGLAGLLLIPLYAGVLIRKLSDARRAAEAASQAKSMFLASVSHELRTPLNAIIGMGALLRETRLEPDQHDMARTMDGAAHALLDMIDDILDLSRVEAGRMPVQAGPCDLPELLEEVRGLVAAQARARGLRLGLHVAAGTPWRVLADRRHLRDILLNLAGNAVKFTEVGGVSLGLAGVPGEAGTVRLRFEVSDTGIGIAAEAQERIFDSFTQATPDIAARFGGSGLGLAICRRLATLLGGVIGIESRPGEGSTVWLTLEAPVLAPPEGLPSLSAATLVVLAGDATVARLEAMLAHTGVVLLRAASASQARALMADILTPQTLVAEPALLDLPPEGASGALTPPPAEMPVGMAVPLLLIGLPPAGRTLPRGAARWAVGSLPAYPTEGELALALRVAGLGADRIACAAHAGGGNLVPTPSLRVLVADDNAINRKVAARILELAGHRVTLVADGGQALDALEDADAPGAEPFDVALMDVNMPGLDGVEATKLYRMASLGQARRLPVLALTADVTPEAESRCLAAGMDGCITKPVQPARLLEALAGLARPAPRPEADRAPPARPVEEPALDAEALAGLASLGDEAFLRSLAEDFIAEAGDLLRRLQAAADSQDGPAFRGEAHALASCAANMGANPLQALCRAAQRLGAEDLAARGHRDAEAVAQEFARVREALARLCSAAPVQG